MKRKGITLVAVVVSIIVLTIIAGTITVSTHSAINYATLTAWIEEIKYIQDVVDETVATSSTLPYTNQIIQIDVTGLTPEEKEEQFYNEAIVNNSIELNVINLGLLRITSTTYGNLKNENDVYAYSLTTGRVYYVQGVEIDRKTYYGLTEEQKNNFELVAENSKLETVIFKPSILGYTTNAIRLTVKVPSNYTNVSITTTNANIQIGSRTKQDEMYVYEVNTNDVKSNYEVTVIYDVGNTTYTTKYTVNSYDDISPVITGVEYDNLIYQENGTSVVDYLSNIQATDSSGIKHFKYTLGTISEENAKAYFSENGYNIIDGKINLDRTNTIYTIYAEDNSGNFSIITFDKQQLMPEDWKENVSYIYNKVPIPNGFIASPYDDENKVNGGLVIYELNENETTFPNNEVQFESWTTRNQFVWVPVDRSTFEDNFIRRNFGMDYDIVQILGSVKEGKSYGFWEVELDEFNIPSASQTTGFMTDTTLLEVTAMYESVKKYGGFYVARYEAGTDNARFDAIDLPKGKQVYSRMNKIVYNNIPWTLNNTMTEDTNGAVEVARSIYPETNGKYGAISTLIYGVQWDTIIQWFLDSNEIDSILNCNNYGNYSATDNNYWILNQGARYTIDEGKNYNLGISNNRPQECLLTTGALKTANLNNIYDMAGNIMEWTMEGGSRYTRVPRGGQYVQSGEKFPIAFRSTNGPHTPSKYFGFRISLYIKLPTINDPNSPVITGVEYDNLVYTGTASTEEYYLSNIEANDETEIKKFKYALGIIAQDNAKEYFSQNGYNIVDNKIDLEGTNNVYTIYAEDKVGNFSTVIFDKSQLMPEDWKENVSYIYKKVPVPNGFVASPYDDENKVNGGLVIYQLDGSETNISSDVSQFDSWTEKNQFVWVPIERDTFEDNFIRKDFGMGYSISEEVSKDFWEVQLEPTLNMPLSQQNSYYISSTTLKEVQEMYSSVKKYGGFYIARYEAGINDQRTEENYKSRGLETTIYSAMAKKPYTYVSWGTTMTDDSNGAVEASRKMYLNVNNGVVSTLTYSVQWDNVLQWWLNTNAVSSVTNSSSYGNYSATQINNDDFNPNSMYAEYYSENNVIGEYKLIGEDTNKPKFTNLCFTTGSIKFTKVNNIYDMAGNVYEFTMEGNYTDSRGVRGGVFISYDGSVNPVSFRTSTVPYMGNAVHGFRPSLYIKLPTT